MPAPFVRELCGYRENRNPNTSDNNDQQSKDIGSEFFQVIGVPPGQPDPGGAGEVMEREVAAHLSELRPDLEVRRSRPVTDFEQYAHLAVFPTFRRQHLGSERHLERLQQLVDSLDDAPLRAQLSEEVAQLRVRLQQQDELVTELLGQMPEEALMRVDVTVAEARRETRPSVLVALSCKWSLRTDRAQDPVTQGAKLVAQRRGRMPHFGVVTIELRPAMLKALCDGSGAIDCVYHLDLPSLSRAWERYAARSRQGEASSPYRTFQRLVNQRRLRDYDDLVRAVLRVPGRETDDQ